MSSERTKESPPSTPAHDGEASRRERARRARAAMRELTERVCTSLEQRDVEALRRDQDALRALVHSLVTAARDDEGDGLSARDDEEVDPQRTYEQVRHDFLSRVSDELRTPLTLVLGPLDALLASTEAPELGPQALASLRIVRRNAARMLSLVDDLLDLSRGEAKTLEAHPTRVDLVDELRALCDDASAAAQARGARVDLVTDLSEAPCATDPRWFDKIVLTLVANALRFTSEGSSVRVELRAAILPEGRGYELRVREPLRDALFSRRERAERLTRLFTRAPSEGARERDATRGPAAEGASGTTARTRGVHGGLGLALVRELAELLGGSVKAESLPGQGLTFIVQVPRGDLARLEPASSAWLSRVRDAAANALARVEEQPTAVFAGEAERSVDDRRAPRARVLLIDPSADLRAFMADALAREAQVFFARDVEEGLAFAEQIGPCVLVIDATSEPESACALVRSVRTSDGLRDAQVLLLTARDAPDAASEVLDAGADDYVQKPFGAAELRSRVRARLRACEAHRALGRMRADLERAREVLTGAERAHAGEELVARIRDTLASTPRAPYDDERAEAPSPVVRDR